MKHHLPKQLVRYLVPTLLLASYQLSWGISVSFNQLDWLNETGGFTAQSSEWGVANIQLSSADAALFTFVPGVGYQAFINVSTELQIPGSSQNWAVQNLPIAFGAPSDLNGRLPEGATFDLGIARGSLNLQSLGSSAIRYGLSVSATTATSMPVLAGPALGVLTAEALFGGEADLTDSYSGSSGKAIPLPAQNFIGALAGEKQSLVGKIFGKESDIPSVDEEKNGCAPGSVARSLRASPLGRHNLHCHSLERENR